MEPSVSVDIFRAAQSAGMTELDLLRWSHTIKKAKEYRSRFVKSANAAKEARLGRTTIAGMDTSLTRNKLNINLLQLRYIARIAAHVSRPAVFHCFGSSVTNDAPGAAGYRLKANEAYLKWTWRKSNVKKVWRKVVADVIDYNRAVVMVDYVTQMEMVPVAPSEVPEDENERHPGPGKPDLIKFENGLVADSVRISRIDPRKLLFDATVDDPLDSPWIGVEFRRNREEILKSSIRNPQIAKLVTGEQPSPEELAEMSPEQKLAIQEQTAVLNLIDIWDKATGKRLLFLRDYVELGPLHVSSWLPGLETKVLLPVFDENGTQVGVKPAVSERVYPFVIYEPRFNNDEPFSRPDAQDLLGIQNGVNELRRLQYDQAVASLPVLLGKRGQVSQDEIDEILMDPNKRFMEVDDPSAYEWLHGPQTSASLDNSATSFKLVFDEMSSMPAMGRGMPTDHQISATEATVVASGQKAIEELDQDELEDAMCKVAELQLRVAASNIKKPIEFAVRIERTIQSFHIVGKDLDPKCIVQIEKGGTRYFDREMQEARTIQRVQTYMGTFGASVGPLEIKRLKEIMLEEFGWGAEGILMPIPDQYQGFLAKTMEMLEQGMPPDEVIETWVTELARADTDLQEAESTALARDMRDMSREGEQALKIVDAATPKPPAGGDNA